MKITITNFCINLWRRDSWMSRAQRVWSQRGWRQKVFDLRMRIIFYFFSIVGCFGLVFSGPVIAEVVYTAQGHAIRGYDSVAYFTQERPVEGKSSHQSRYQGALWLFSSAENKALFDADPQKYAPQYGGYCAWAVSQGYTARIDPKAWSIVKDKLYLNYSKAVRDQWSRDIPANIADGDANWPQLRADLAAE